MLSLPIRFPQLSNVSAPHSAPLPLPIKQVETETYGQRLETEINENTVRDAKKIKDTIWQLRVREKLKLCSKVELKTVK